MSTLLLALTSLALGYCLAWRCFPERSRQSLLGGAPLLATIVVIGWANFLGPVACRIPATVVNALIVGILCLPRWSRSEPAREADSRWWWGKAVLLFLILFYVGFAQYRYLDTDNWIHEPLIGGYTLGLFPPVHPYFPEAAMNGHYGRDLLIGTLTPHGTDPLTVVWLLNPLLAVCGALILLSTLERFCTDRLTPLMGAAFPFFGMCVGFRVGLVDTTDGNNGLVYAQALLLFYLMLAVLDFMKQPEGAARWILCLISGFVLGLYQLVYETHFGLLLLTACTLLPLAVKRSDHRKRLLGGVALTATVALLLAVTEGGPITDLARSKALGQQAVVGTADEAVSDLNVEQHVSLRFPKEQLLKVRATAADYQRLSVGFKAGPFEGLAPPITDSGYISIFHPNFLVTHWLPLFLCPFTLLWVIRARRWDGLAFWLFGAWAYLVPGLIDFGPVYEWEYFRWEFAAGFGWSVPLGLFCGHLLRLKPDQKPLFQKDEESGWQVSVNRRHWPQLVGAVVLVVGLLPGEKLLNQAIIDIQKRGLPGPVTPAGWRLRQPDLGLAGVDLEIAGELARVIEPGDRVMTNLGDETPFGLWPDSVLSGLTGARMSGRARPPVDRRVHAHPNYHRSTVWKVMESLKRLDPVWLTDTRWMVIDPEVGPFADLLKNSPHTKLIAEKKEKGDRRQLWRLQSPDTVLSPDQANEQPLTMVASKPSISEWRTASVYPLEVKVTNTGGHPTKPGWLKLKIVDSEKRAPYQPLHFLLSDQPLGERESLSQTVAFVTPLEEGSFQVVGSFLGEDGAQPAFEFPLEVDFRKRLEELKASIETPDGVLPKTLVTLKLSLTSEHPIVSSEELQLLLRLRREGGDFVWEMDRIPIELPLALPKGGTTTIEWKVMAPWQVGAYVLELEILDRRTGLRTPVKQAEDARLLVVSP